MTQRSALLTDRAIRIVAEDKIRAAIARGEFDNLPGLGRPHPIFDEPYDPLWWVRRKLIDEGLSPKILAFDSPFQGGRS